MVFERIVVGVDGSEAGFEALRQARRLVAANGRLLAVAVCEVSLAAHAGFLATEAAATLIAEAKETSRKALAELEGMANVEARIVEGRPIPALLALVERERADLLAVGTHGAGRAAGMVLGRVATTMLHRAPCPVLVARAAADLERFPRSIVVGLDGSPESLAVLELAGDAAARFETKLRVLAAEGGKGILPAGLEGVPGLERVPGKPVDALVEASRSADLVVLGSRGLHGIRALGSVSERVAHRASCSVLVVRHPKPERPTSAGGEGTRAGDIMTADVLTVSPDAPLEEVARLMKERNVGGVPVVDPEAGLVGIVTDSDFTGREIYVPFALPARKRPQLFGRWLDEGRFAEALEAARRLPVSAVMSSPVVCVQEDEPVSVIVGRMLQHDIDRLPVLRDGQLVGIVARHDLLGLMLRQRAEDA